MTKIQIAKAVDAAVKIYFDYDLSINQAIDKAKEMICNDKEISKMEKVN